MQQNKEFQLVTEFQPAGDQIGAIKELSVGLEAKKRDQVLLGVTGSGKTYTMANVIAEKQRPALILAHNKTLAAQLYGEMKSFFPNNSVEYFVSYYDYYQPEAYIPKTDTYIEKDSSINEQIDLLRHSATRSLLEKPDVIVVASVSCIYGLGSPELYSEMTIKLEKGQRVKMSDVIRELVELQYDRHNVDFFRGNFRVKGDSLDIYPAHLESRAWRLSFFGDEIEQIFEIDPISGDKLGKLDRITVFASSHYVTPKPTLMQAMEQIKIDLAERLEYLRNHDKIIEAHRLEQKTNFDLEMIKETGSCKGIENYSRYLSGRNPGEPPPTLFEYLPKNSILFVDESHVTVPQIGGMFNGDRARKNNLVDHGFRLPSALDNRPLQFSEWDKIRPQTIYVSATPGKYELEQCKGEYIRQVIRPTGLVDPECFVRPVETQVDDVIHESREVIKRGLRVLITTLTKKMAENLTDYLKNVGLKVSYLHSDITTLNRIEIIQELRRGDIDIIVGINLLREGLDIPECGMVAILDADKEGFLRSETSLIQTIGRAARNSEAKVILYADKMTNSLTNALNETNKRREIQMAHNKKHGITPKTVKKDFTDIIENLVTKDGSKDHKVDFHHNPKDIEKDIKKLKKQMFEYASSLEFEKAAKIRDELEELEKLAILG